MRERERERERYKTFYWLADTDPIPLIGPNTRSRPRIPNPGGDFPSPERYGVYIAAIYTPTSPLVSRRATIPGGFSLSGEGRRIYRGDIYAYLAVSIKANPPPLPTSPFPRCQYFASLAAATLFPPHAARAYFAIPSPRQFGRNLGAIVRPELRGESTNAMSPTSPERDEWRGTAEVRRKCGEGRRVYRGVVIADLSNVCWVSIGIPATTLKSPALLTTLFNHSVRGSDETFNLFLRFLLVFSFLI